MRLVCSGAPTSPAAAARTTAPFLACFGGLAVEGNPRAAAFVIVCEEVGSSDRFHFLTRTRLGRTHAEHLNKGLVIHALGQDDARGLTLGPLFGNLQRADGQCHGVHDRRCHACAHSHRQEGIVNPVPVGQSERDVGCPAGRVHA